MINEILYELGLPYVLGKYVFWLLFVLLVALVTRNRTKIKTMPVVLVPALIVLLVLLSLTGFEAHDYYAGPFAFLYRFEIAWTIAENSYLITGALVLGAWLITVPVIIRAIKKDSEPTDDGLFDEEFD